MTNLKKIIAEISAKLSVELNYYAEGEPKKNVPYCEKPFETLTDDGENTFFRFTYRGEGYVGVLSGVESERKNYAFLLPAYLENLSMEKNELSKEAFLKGLLLGDCPHATALRYTAKYALGNLPCFVVLLQIPKHLEEAIALCTQYTGNSLDAAVRLSDDSFAIVKFILRGDDGATAVDYAEFLCQTLKEELGIDAQIGVGERVKTLEDVAQSYAQAEAAITYANLFESTERVHTYRQYLLVKLLEELPQARLAEYASILSDEKAQEIFSDAEMTETAEEFLRNSLNVSETARQLYVHRNTLIYRLDKIKEATGLNLRSFADAVSFRVITLLHKLKGR